MPSAIIRQARIAGALGGRVAEQLVFGASQVTTGAGGDLQQVERMARAMVTQFGMSEAGTHNARTQYLYVIQLINYTKLLTIITMCTI